MIEDAYPDYASSITFIGKSLPDLYLSSSVALGPGVHGIMRVGRILFDLSSTLCFLPLVRPKWPSHIILDSSNTLINLPLSSIIPSATSSLIF